MMDKPMTELHSITCTCPICDPIRRAIAKASHESLQGIEAIRNTVEFRYDLLDEHFLHAMAEIAHYGAQTYGDRNWQKSRLGGDKSPINHIYKHLGQYRSGDKYDHLDGNRRYHLAAVAFNAMIEFWYFNKFGDEHGTTS